MLDCDELALCDEVAERLGETVTVFDCVTEGLWVQVPVVLGVKDRLCVPVPEGVRLMDGLTDGLDVVVWLFELVGDIVVDMLDVSEELAVPDKVRLWL